MMSRFGSCSKYAASMTGSISASTTFSSTSPSTHSSSSLFQQSRILSAGSNVSAVAARVQHPSSATPSPTPLRRFWWGVSAPGGPLPSHQSRAPPLFSATTTAATNAAGTMASTLSEWRQDPMIREGPIHFLSSWILFFMMCACCLGSYQRIHTAQEEVDPVRASKTHSALMWGWLSESRTTHTPVGI